MNGIFADACRVSSGLSKAVAGAALMEVLPGALGPLFLTFPSDWVSMFFPLLFLLRQGFSSFLPAGRRDALDDLSGFLSTFCRPSF